MSTFLFHFAEFCHVLAVLADLLASDLAAQGEFFGSELVGSTLGVNSLAALGSDFSTFILAEAGQPTLLLFHLLLLDRSFVSSYCPV